MSKCRHGIRSRTYHDGTGFLCATSHDQEVGWEKRGSWAIPLDRQTFKNNDCVQCRRVVSTDPGGLISGSRVGSNLFDLIFQFVIIPRVVSDRLLPLILPPHAHVPFSKRAHE